MSNTLRPTCNDCGTDTRGAAVHLVKREGLGYAMICEDCAPHRLLGVKVIRTFPWEHLATPQCHCGRTTRHAALYVIEHDSTGEVAHRCETHKGDEVRAGGLITDILSEQVTRANVMWRLENQLMDAYDALDVARERVAEFVYHVQTAPASGPYLMDVVNALCDARECERAAQDNVDTLSTALENLARMA